MTEPFYTYGFGGVPITSGYYGPATIVSTGVPAPIAPTLAGCTGTASELAYLSLYGRLSRGEITLLQFWGELIYNGTTYGVNNAPVSQALADLRTYSSETTSFRSASKGKIQAFPSFNAQVYSKLQPPKPVTFKCALPGTVAAVTFGTSYTNAPEPVAQFQDVITRLPAPYCYTPIDCLQVGIRAYENSFGEANSYVLTTAPFERTNLGDIAQIELPDKSLVEARAVGKEFNATGLVITKTTTFNKLVSVGQADEVEAAIRKSSLVEYYNPNLPNLPNGTIPSQINLPIANEYPGFTSPFWTSPSWGAGVSRQTRTVIYTLLIAQTNFVPGQPSPTVIGTTSYEYTLPPIKIPLTESGDPVFQFEIFTPGTVYPGTPDIGATSNLRSKAPSAPPGAADVLNPLPFFPGSYSRLQQNPLILRRLVI